MQRGYESFLGIAKETSWGTAVTATAFLEYNSESMKKDREGHILEAIGSTGRAPLKRYLGNTTVAGNIECPLNIFEDAVAMLINNAMGGSVASTGDATNGYNHIPALGPMDSGTTSLTVTKRIGTATDLFVFSGCRVNTLTIRGEVGTPEIMLSAELVGRDGTTSTDSLTVAISANDPLLWSGVTYETADTVSSLDGSTGAEAIQSFELTLQNNLQTEDASRDMGTDILAVMPVGKVMASLKITQRYDTSTAYGLAEAETEKSVRISMDSGVTIGTAGTTGSIMFTFPKAEQEYSGAIPETGEPGIIQHERTWTPLQPTTGQDYVSCEYNNNTASY